MAAGYTAKDALFAASSVLAAGVRRSWRGPERAAWSWLDELVISGLRGAFGGAGGRPLADIRRQFDRVGLLEAPRGRSTWREDRLGGVPVAWVGPPDGGRDLLLFVHGGGYAFGSPRSHRVLMADLAVACDIEVVGVDYRLAPEHPCPAAIDDVLAVYRELLHTHPAARMVWVGDSAGAGLMLTTLAAVRRLGLPEPSGLVCLSPWVDLTCSGASHQTNHHADYIGVAGVIPEFAKAYAGSLPLDDPRVSPGLHPLGTLPPMLIQVGSAEILHDDALLLARRAADGDVTLQVWPDAVHVWHAFSVVLPSSRRALRAAADWIRTRLP